MQFLVTTVINRLIHKAFFHHLTCLELLKPCFAFLNRELKSGRKLNLIRHMKPPHCKEACNKSHGFTWVCYLQDQDLKTEGTPSQLAYLWNHLAENVIVICIALETTKILCAHQDSHFAWVWPCFSWYSQRSAFSTAYVDLGRRKVQSCKTL